MSCQREERADATRAGWSGHDYGILCDRTSETSDRIEGGGIRDREEGIDAVPDGWPRGCGGRGASKARHDRRERGTPTVARIEI